MLLPPLDHAASADHALERFAPLPGGIEHRAIFQGAGVLGGDQRALDHGFAVAQADVGDLQFVVAHGVLIEGSKAGVFPESEGFGKCREMANVMVDRSLECIQPRQNPMWELACLRRRGVSQSTSESTTPFAGKPPPTNNLHAFRGRRVDPLQPMPEPAPEPAPQLILAPGILARIHLRTRLYLARYRRQPGFAGIGALAVAAPAFVVVQVLAVGIVFVDAVDGVGLVHVPADKVDRVVEVFAISAAAAGGFAVVVPYFILGLGIAGSGGDAAPWDDPQQVFTRGLGVVAKARLLIHDGKRHLDRYAPALLRDLGGVVPVVFFAEDTAEVVGRAWRRGAARRQQGSE